jgi:hypothetical protein
VENFLKGKKCAFDGYTNIFGAVVCGNLIYERRKKIAILSTYPIFGIK